MLPRALCLILILSLLTPASAKDKFSQPRPIQLDRDGEKWAEKTLHKLSLEEKVGHLFMIRSVSIPEPALRGGGPAQSSTAGFQTAITDRS